MKFSAGLLLFVSCAFYSVFSAPVPRNHAASTDDVSHYTHPAYVHPAFDGDLFVSHDDHGTLGSREYTAVDLLPRTRGAAKVAKAAAKAVRVQKAQDKGKVSPKRPANAKVTFGNAARARLDRLELHGKDRKKAKQYHKAIVKQDMPKHGADSARVFQLAHPGGLDQNERNHITAGYYRPPAHGKPGEQIKSPWAEKHEAETGTTTKGLFHVYPEDQKHNRPPTAWKNAVAASDARKRAEEERIRAQAERQAKEKAHRIAQAKEVGQSLTAEQKKALRDAAKAARLAKKGGGNGS